VSHRRSLQSSVNAVAVANKLSAHSGLFDRALGQKLTAKKAKFLFKKWLNIETRIGDVQGQEKAKEKAREWVVANAKPEVGADGSEEDEDDE
jgi:rRNA biogenesis protein RRP5